MGHKSVDKRIAKQIIDADAVINWASFWVSSCLHLKESTKYLNPVIRQHIAPIVLNMFILQFLSSAPPTS